MSVVSSYKQASFRGVNFFIKSEKEQSGKKIVIHQYPNSDRKFVEELGVLPSSYSFNACVHGPRAIEDSLNLMRVLSIPGIGILVHPVYGRVEVKSTTFERSTNESEMGEIVFELNFEKSESNISLSPAVSTTSAVSSFADTARTAGFSALSAALIINKAQQALVTVQRVSTSVLQVANGNFRALGGSNASGLSAFDRVFKTSLKNLYQVSLAADLFTKTFENFYTAARTIVDPAGQRKAWQSLTFYGSNRVQGPITTEIRRAQEINTNSVNAHTRINALINLFESTAYTSFMTDQELSAAQKLLADTFETLFNGSSDDLISSDRDLISAVLDLRSATSEVLNESAKNVFRIREVIPGETSLPLFNYQYYGNLNILDTLLDLNAEQNWADVGLGDIIKAVE